MNVCSNIENEEEEGEEAEGGIVERRSRAEAAMRSPGHGNDAMFCSLFFEKKKNWRVLHFSIFLKFAIWGRSV